MGRIRHPGQLPHWPYWTPWRKGMSHEEICERYVERIEEYQTKAEEAEKRFNELEDEIVPLREERREVCGKLEILEPDHSAERKKCRELSSKYDKLYDKQRDAESDMAMCRFRCRRIEQRMEDLGCEEIL